MTGGRRTNTQLGCRLPGSGHRESPLPGAASSGSATGSLSARFPVRNKVLVLTWCLRAPPPRSEVLAHRWPPKWGGRWAHLWAGGGEAVEVGAEGGAPGNLQELSLGLWSLGVPDEASKPEAELRGPRKGVPPGSPQQAPGAGLPQEQGSNRALRGSFQRTHRTPQEASACGRLSPSKDFATAASRRPALPPPGPRWPGDRVPEKQHSRRPRAQLAPRVDTSLGPHFNDVEIEAQGRAGIPKSCSAILWPPTLPQPTPSPSCSYSSPIPSQ